MQDFLGHVRASPATRGPTAGQRVSAAHAKTVLVRAEQFYLFMHDHKDAAAAATGEPDGPGWEPGTPGLPDPGTSPPGPALDIIENAAMTKIMTEDRPARRAGRRGRAG
jgi:hypothetical protein